jgi:hypothetical protein
MVNFMNKLGQNLGLAMFCKILSQTHLVTLILTKMVLAVFWEIFFPHSSGHPDQKPITVKLLTCPCKQGSEQTDLGGDASCEMLGQFMRSMSSDNSCGRGQKHARA